MKKTNIKTKYQVGDTIHEIYWDSDIDAWNTHSFRVQKVNIAITMSGVSVTYHESEIDECGMLEETEVFETSLAAADECKRRNKKQTQDLSYSDRGPCSHWNDDEGQLIEIIVDPNLKEKIKWITQRYLKN